MIKTVLFATAAALATVGTATPVLAKEVVVHYSDLDLASEEGQTTLARRINRAARDACEFGSEPSVRSQEAISCFREARGGAAAQVATLIVDGHLGS